MKTLIFLVSTIVLVWASSKSWEEVWNKGQKKLEVNPRIQLLKLDFMVNLLFEQSNEALMYGVHEVHMV